MISLHEILENLERTSRFCARRLIVNRLPETRNQIRQEARIGQNVPLSVAINDDRKTYPHFLLSGLVRVPSHYKINTDKFVSGEFQNQTRRPVKQVKKLIISIEVITPSKYLGVAKRAAVFKTVDATRAQVINKLPLCVRRPFRGGIWRTPK